MINDTIVALSTPRLTSALSVIRMSGEDSFEIFEKIFDKKIPEFEKRIILVGNIKDKNETVDNVVVSLFKNPYSFTGENTVEISCHGGLLIINKVLTLLISNGARQAERGEFSKKAFYNNKIDLLQAESINDLIMSKSSLASSMAMKGLKGQLTDRIDEIKAILLELLAHAEVNIDYPEYEDIEEISNEVLLPKCQILDSMISSLLKDSENGILIKDGINVALIGKPNAGKSSLLNALIEEDKAIVTDIAGTTRDVVEGSLSIDGLLFNILDTAGIRDPKDEIEAIGVNKSKEAIQKSDLELIVIDGSLSLDQQNNDLNEFINQDKPYLVVINKCDQNKTHINGIEISALNHSLNDLKNQMVKKIGIDIEDISNKSILSNSRQIGLLTQASNNIKKALEDIACYTPVDLVIISLHEALNNLNDIIGASSKEDLDNEIFSKFCIGK